MPQQLPAGWPPGVHPPGSEDFEPTAVAWLLDILPPEFREHKELHRYPAALALIARHYTRASLEGARQAYRRTRPELGGRLKPHQIDTILSAYRVEGRRLAAIAQAAAAIERALRTPSTQRPGGNRDPR